MADFVDPGVAGTWEFNFTGTGIRYGFSAYGQPLPTRIRIILDGVFKQEIYTATTYGSAAEKWSALNLPAGNHTLRIEHPASFAEHGICDYVEVI